MNTESKKFLLTNIKRKLLPSNEIRANRNVSSPTRGPIECCDVKCSECANEWHASDHGEGRIKPHCEGFFLICPKCSARCEFANKDLNSK